MALRGGQADSAATRAALLNASLELFARHGVSAVSIRSINAVANLGPAAVHYHFRTKGSLIDAVVRRQGVRVVQEIEASLERCRRVTPAPSARELVDVIAGPCVALLKREPVQGSQWLEVVAGLLLSDHPAVTVGLRPVRDRYSALVRTAYPACDAERLDTVIYVATDTLVRHLARAHGPTASSGGRESADDRIASLLDFVAGGLLQSLGPTARADRRKAG
jgi:AcrR family transcriptional regulator